VHRPFDSKRQTLIESAWERVEKITEIFREPDVQIKAGHREVRLNLKRIGGRLGEDAWKPSLSPLPGLSGQTTRWLGTWEEQRRRWGMRAAQPEKADRKCNRIQFVRGED
jgi:hypothetical protein